MAVWIGTSGYNYPEWRGTFYPEGFPESEMLAYYAERLNTVEINYTFYRMPSEKALLGWAEGTPERFRLALKAPQRITHQSRLRDCAETVEVFLKRAALLKEKLGPVLFQLPPWMRKDVPLLEEFSGCLPEGTRAAFEFRHRSWFEDEVYECLKSRDLALCIADSEKLSTPPVRTAGYGYLRLRDEGYGPADVARWAVVVNELAGSASDVFVYFKHEEAGMGPAFARQLIDELGLKQP